MTQDNQTWKQKLSTNWKSLGKKTEWMETSTGKLLVVVLALAMILWSAYGAYETKKEREMLNGENAPQEQYLLKD